jgi:hypothetical protein
VAPEIWLVVPERQLLAVADSSYAVIELLDDLRAHLTVISRLRLDARLFEPASPRPPGRRGRAPLTGVRLPSLEQRLGDAKTVWQRVRISSWYGGGERQLDITSGTAVTLRRSAAARERSMSAVKAAGHLLSWWGSWREETADAITSRTGGRIRRHRLRCRHTECVGERVPCWDTPRRIAQALDLLAHQPGGAAELTTAQSVAARPPKARAPRPRCA